MSAPTERPRNLDRLPLRIEGPLARILGAAAGEVTVLPRGAGTCPALRGELARSAPEHLSLVLRVHAPNGVPLAAIAADVAAGARTFETEAVRMLAMEGYSHLAETERRAVEDRVWSRRAYATVGV